jgi:NADH-quinone oxidoreductase subunit M
MVPGSHLLSVLIFLPAIGSLALLLLRGDDHVWIRRLALTISVAEFLLSLLLVPGVPLGVAGYNLVEDYRWIADPPIHYHLGVDGISLFLVILTTFLTPI